MTVSQSRAINAIAKRLDMDPAAECQEILGLDLAKLNIRQASEFIDPHLTQKLHPRQCKAQDPLLASRSPSRAVS